MDQLWEQMNGDRCPRCARGRMRFVDDRLLRCDECALLIQEGVYVQLKRIAVNDATI